MQLIGFSLASGTKALAVNYVSRSHSTTNYQCDQSVSLLYLFVFVLYSVIKIYDNKAYRLNCLGPLIGPKKGTARVEINRITRLQDKTIEGNLKRNIPEEDVDTPFKSGVVRVFKQPGIECPCDEDDYIQKPWKPCSSIQGFIVSTGLNKIFASFVGEASSNIHTEGRGMVNKEPIMASQPLAPISTSTLDTDAHTEIRPHTSKILQRGSTSSISGAAEDHGSNVMSETEYKAVDNVQTSLGDWGNARMDQQMKTLPFWTIYFNKLQVIPLTQTQLDDAMKPARFNTTHVTSIGPRIGLERGTTHAEINRITRLRDKTIEGAVLISLCIISGRSLAGSSTPPIRAYLWIARSGPASAMAVNNDDSLEDESSIEIPKTSPRPIPRFFCVLITAAYNTMAAIGASPSNRREALGSDLSE
ncbi:hypothetical protein Tco_1078208 [Tanacetum coccineum]